jgi:hypothetical protein
MNSPTFLFSNLKTAKSANGFSDAIISFDYRITLVDSGKAAYRYGNCDLVIPPLGAEGFIAFEQITEDVMIDFLRQSMSGQLEEIKQEMGDEIASAGLIAEACLPWSKEVQGNG